MKMIFLFAAASMLWAQDVPVLSNAHLETRPYAGDLDSQLRSTPPTWFGYQIKTVQQGESCCWSDSNRGCWLEGDSGQRMQGVKSNGPVHLEGTNSSAVLFRVADNHVGRVQVFSMSCPLDAGGLPFVWLTGVPSQESLAELHKLSMANTSDHVTEGAIFAIAQHDDPRADTILDELATSNQPERTREKVAFWLGSSRGASGVRALQKMLQEDANDNIRDKAVFALSISKQPEAMAILITAAHRDSSAHVRSQAIFWLGQKAGKQAMATIVDAIENDPDTEVKKKAVFALSQLPKDDGIPRLIEVAQTQKNAEVRKQAIFWLGQSGDPRALTFIEKVLGQ